MNKALISLGSNTSEAVSNIQKCITLIEDMALKSSFSPVFKSEPEGVCKSNEYTNCIAEIETENTQEFWNSFFKETEKAFGRNDETRLMGIVPVDLDIVVWNDEIIREKDYKSRYFKKGFSLIKNRI